METTCHIPNSFRSAGYDLRQAFGIRLQDLSHQQFVRSWSAVAYLFPNLHPDELENHKGGWPRALKSIANEAWRRAEAGELSDEELYPCDAQWCGIYDRLPFHLPEEIERRIILAADFGEVL